MAVVREITKVHEEVFRGFPRECLAHFENYSNPKGEYVFVIKGAEDVKEINGNEGTTDTKIAEYVKQLEEAGVDRRVAIKETAALFDLHKKDVYNAMLREKQKQSEKR